MRINSTYKFMADRVSWTEGTFPPPPISITPTPSSACPPLIS